MVLVEFKHTCCSNYNLRACVFPQGCSDVPGFMQAVLSLLLPLAYEFDPSLVLLVRTPGSEVCDSAWQQLTCLLQGLAQGHTLVLMHVSIWCVHALSFWLVQEPDMFHCRIICSSQEADKSHVATTVSCLLGNAAPPLGPLRAPLADHMEALERLRHRLQNEWKLLQTRSEWTWTDKHHASHNLILTASFFFFLNVSCLPATGTGEGAESWRAAIQNIQ